MVTGLRPATFENLQLNAGVFLEGFDWSSYTTPAALEEAILAKLESGEGVIGATIGGGSFVCTPSIRQIEADGMRYPIIGSTVNDMWTIELTGTMKEVNAENFKRTLMTAEESAENGVKVLTLRTDIERKDYIPKLSWVGDTSKGFILIELDNVLNVEGVTFTFTDKGEGSIPFRFQAHASNLNTTYAPCRIAFFDEEAS